MAGARLPEWRGRLESLSTTGLTDFALSAPAALVVSAERVELGEAVFSGEPGEVRLAVTRWTPSGLETRGSSNAVVVRTIRQLLKMQGEVGSNLVLAGQWDLRVGDSVDGFVSIRRERGDVRVGEPRQALGLEVLALRMDATGGRVKATVDIRGKQAGQWKGEASATLARGSEGWEISPVAPLDGRFTVDVPDLAWTAALAGSRGAGGRAARRRGHARGHAARAHLERARRGHEARDPRPGARRGSRGRDDRHRAEGPGGAHRALRAVHAVGAVAGGGARHRRREAPGRRDGHRRGRDRPRHAQGIAAA